MNALSHYDLGPDVTESDMDHATNDWLRKLHGGDMADELAEVGGLLMLWVRAGETELVGKIVHAVMVGYAARLAKRDLLDDAAAAAMPDAQAIAAAVLAGKL